MRIKAKDDGAPPEWTVPRWMIDEGDPALADAYGTQIDPDETEAPDDDGEAHSHRADA